jgi:membrane protein YdbS with pleckstrin-like domain
MSNNSSNSKSGGVGFLGLLFLVFLVLKLTHVIDWSWWWVTCPLWGVVALLIVFTIIFYLIGIIQHIFRKWRKKRNAKIKEKH